MTVGEVHKIMAPAKPNVQSESDFDGVGTSHIESYDVKDGKVFGKDVTSRSTTARSSRSPRAISAS